VKIPHAGAVRIGRSVEIGANTTVDRGKLGDTLIGDGTKIDNLVQIGHNCVVGRSCVICGASALAGSVTLGDGVTLAGAVTIGDNLKVGDGATLGARSAVMNDIPAGESWVGVPAEPMKESMRKYAAWRKLPDALKRLQRLERDRGSAGGGSERGGGSDAG
jgi:UDP-3-O-[3-hydroxymyristoyl] glucosamine N-acyltransferase